MSSIFLKIKWVFSFYTSWCMVREHLKLFMRQKKKIIRYSSKISNFKKISFAIYKNFIINWTHFRVLKKLQLTLVNPKMNGTLLIHWYTYTQRDITKPLFLAVLPVIIVHFWWHEIMSRCIVVIMLFIFELRYVLVYIQM